MKTLRIVFLWLAFCSPSFAQVGQIPTYIQPAGGASLACSYTPVTTGTQSSLYTGATPSASGGTPSYTFSETGSLPTGLAINSSTGVISGTPSVSGSFTSIQVKVTDSVSNTANCGSAFTLVISPSGASGWCSLIPQSGLVNCWPMDTANTTVVAGSGTATDVIGGKNATLSNMSPLNGSGPSANLNNAIVCNGTSSRGDTSLAGMPTAAFSVVMWVNTSSAANGRAMANDHTDNDNKGFQAIVGAQALLWLGNGTSASNASAGAISSATWTMASWTYDATNIKGYKNATLNATIPFTGPVAASAGAVPISFCVNPAYNGDWYPGMIAGVAIYNRALTSGELTTINGL